MKAMVKEGEAEAVVEEEEVVVVEGRRAGEGHACSGVRLAVSDPAGCSAMLFFSRHLLACSSLHHCAYMPPPSPAAATSLACQACSFSA